MLDFLGAKKIFHLQIEENLPLFTLFEALNWPLLVGMSRMNFHFDHFKKKELNYLFSGISKTHFSVVKTFFLLMELWVERLEGKHSTFLSHILVKCIVKPFSSKHSFLLKVVFPLFRIPFWRDWFCLFKHKDDICFLLILNTYWKIPPNMVK